MNYPPLAQLAEASALRAEQCGFNSLKGDHPKYKPPIWKIYGPYQRADKRQHVIAYNGTNRITISFPKFIVECLLKQELKEDEEVHHKNEIEWDDRIDNFEIINKSVHIRKHRLKTSLPDIFLCPVCNQTFTLDSEQIRQLISNRKRRPDMKGPYCSKSCSGKVNN